MPRAGVGKGSRGLQLCLHPGPLTPTPPRALQMWMSVRPGTCVTMASVPTHQAPSSVSASLAIICQGTEAAVKVRGAYSWGAGLFLPPPEPPRATCKQANHSLAWPPSSSKMKHGVWATTGALREAWQPQLCEEQPLRFSTSWIPYRHR